MHTTNSQRSIYQKINVHNVDVTEYMGAKASEKQYNWAIKQQSLGSFLKMFNVFQTLISSVILLEMNARALVSIIFVKI